MNLTELLIGSLVTYRISVMFVRDVGPNAIFAKLRAYLAKRQRKVGGLYDMVSCVSCISVYIAFLTSLAFAQGVLEIFLYTFAFSAVSKLIEALISSKS